MVSAITETWLRPGALFRLPGYSCLRDDRTDGWGGSALFINNSYPYIYVPLPSHSDRFNAVAARVKNITFLSLYIPYPTSQILSEVKNIFESLTPPVLILGDFNCHHPLWGSSVSDSVGNKLNTIIDQLNLCILNDGSATRRVSPTQGKRAVDLSMCSPSLASLLSWNISDLSYGSDHLPINITLPICAIPCIDLAPLLKYRLSDADWDKFSTTVENKILSLPTVQLENIDICYCKLVETLLTAADEVLPVKNSSKNKFSSPPWWDKECSQAVKSRNDSEKIYKNNMSMEKFLEFKKSQAQSKRLFRKKKRDGWNGFCSSISPSTHSSVVWNNIKRYRSAFNNQDHKRASTMEWTEQFLDKLAPPSVPQLEELPKLYSIPAENNIMNDSFSYNELCQILKKIKDSAPGEDGIPYSFIVKSGEITQRYLLDIINQVFNSGHIPDSWKSQIIIPILKPQKDPEQSTSYRPIALSSVLSKITEHLVKNRLEWYVEHHDLLPKNQFGFRKSKSTMDGLGIFTTDIRLAFSRNESVVAAFVDVSAAYDNVLLPILTKKMLNLKIPAKIVHFISNLLVSRQINLRLKGSQTSTRTLWKGLPQGSVLSPLLFNIYTCDLERSVNSTCRILQYADDLLIYVINKSIPLACSVINEALQSLGIWLTAHGLELSAAKSNVVIFSRKRIIPTIVITYDNEIIPILKEVKFLGVILDSGLTGIPHLKYVTQKCEKNINILRTLSGVWWGAHPFSQKLLYNALIRSQMDYGSFILEPCNKTAIRTLDLIQSKSLRIITGAMKSSPINSLQVECCEPPLHLRRQYLCDRYLSKAAQLSSHPILPKLRLLSEYISSKPYWRAKGIPRLVRSFNRLQTIRAPIHASPRLPTYDTKYEAVMYNPDIDNVNISKDTSNANIKFEKIVNYKWKDWDYIFTDASKLSDQGCVGSAFYHKNADISMKFKSPPEASVFTGECIAIMEAISYIKQLHLPRTVIFTDSLSSIQALQQNPFKSKINSSIIIRIKELLFDSSTDNINVVLTWIPSHTGIIGNELVDAMAKDAILSGDRKNFNIQPYDLLEITKTRLTNSWNSQWNRSSRTKGAYFSAIQPCIPSKPWFFKVKTLSKKTTSIICRLRIGHNCLPVHLAKLRIKDSSLCECGLEDGDIEHTFFACPNYCKNPIYSSLIKINIPLPVNMKYLLSFPHPKIISILSEFVKINDINL